ncbi:MAG TPA: hypothetical protein VLE73_01920 [Candidatus Saccharimonadales bacterium]|nr:hypothetical protein [Candidatus Saccharimonadales bacterium]
MAPYGPNGGNYSDSDLRALRNIVSPQSGLTTSLDMPLPEGRVLTLFEAKILHTLQHNAAYVELPVELSYEDVDPISYSMNVITKRAGGTVLQATVVARDGFYAYTRLSGPLVARKLGKEAATLCSLADGTVKGESPTEGGAFFTIEGPWQRLLPEGLRVAGRLGVLFANSEPVFPKRRTIPQ